MTTRSSRLSSVGRTGVHITLLAMPLLLASTAYADTISVGFQEAGFNGNAITTVGTSSTGNLGISNLSYGTFTVNDVSAQSRIILGPPSLLNSQNLDVSSSTAGVLTIYITVQGLSFTGAQLFASSFAVNDLEGSVSAIRESTYFSPTNDLYNTNQTLLDSALFNDIGIRGTNFATGTTNGLYSVTERYQIIDLGGTPGNDNITIDLAARGVVPEPGSLLLMGTGLALAALLFYRRRNNQPRQLIGIA